MGGVEHAILHLLYARFVGKFLYKEGIITGDRISLAKGEVSGILFQLSVLNSITLFSALHKFACTRYGIGEKPQMPYNRSLL